MYLSEVKACTHTKTHPDVHSSIITIAKRGNNPNVYQWWMNKTWYIHTREYYSEIKKDKTLMHATTWMKPSKRYSKWKRPDTQGHILHHSSCCEDTLVHKMPWEKCLASSSPSVLRLGPRYITRSLPASPGIPGRLAVLFPREPGLISSPSTAGDYFHEAQGSWESSPEYLHWPITMVVATEALERAGHSEAPYPNAYSQPPRGALRATALQSGEM